MWALWLEAQNLPLNRAKLNGGKTGELGRWHFRSLQEEGKKQDHSGGLSARNEGVCFTLSKTTDD